MSLIPAFSTGHGGVINGVYQTKGKQSPDWDKGILYEGMFNRWVVNRLIEKLDRASIPYYHVSPEYEDISLNSRVDRGNLIYAINKNTYYFSIHANAGGGKGIEGFTSVGQTKSDLIAEEFLKDLSKLGIKMRTDKSDGDLDKEAKFYELRMTKGPSFLLECGFMDEKTNYDMLWSHEYLDRIVCTLFGTIERLYIKGL